MYIIFQLIILNINAINNKHMKIISDDNEVALHSYESLPGGVMDNYFIYCYHKYDIFNGRTELSLSLSSTAFVDYVEEDSDAERIVQTKDAEYPLTFRHRQPKIISNADMAMIVSRIK